MFEVITFIDNIQVMFFSSKTLLVTILFMHAIGKMYMAFVLCFDKRFSITCHQIPPSLLGVLL